MGYMVKKIIVGIIFYSVFFLNGCSEEGDTSLYFYWLLYNKNDSTSILTAAKVEMDIESKLRPIVYDENITNTGILTAHALWGWLPSEVIAENPVFTLSVYDFSNTIRWDTAVTWEEANIEVKPIPGEDYSNFLSEIECYVDW